MSCINSMKPLRSTDEREGSHTPSQVFLQRTSADNHREDGENPEKDTNWQREQQPLPNLTQIYLLLFLLKNESLNLQKE